MQPSVSTCTVPNGARGGIATVDTGVGAAACNSPIVWRSNGRPSPIGRAIRFGSYSNAAKLSPVALAAWAAILAVPTAIAGIYGMNFEHMPELKTRYGYFVVLAVILLICSILYRRFRKLNWL